MTGRATPGRHSGPQPKVRWPILSVAPGIAHMAAGRLALLCGHGRIEPYEPRRVCLVEFSDALS
jgi:hypothetical protein